MKIKIIKCLQDNYSYLIIDETNNTACVIDPSEAKPILKFLENNKIVLIDSNSGRPMPGRRLSGGVHQALEMKENLQWNLKIFFGQA